MPLEVQGQVSLRDVDVDSCRSEARTVEDRQGDDQLWWGRVSAGGGQWLPTGRCPGTTDFLLVSLPPSQSAGFLSEGVLACLLAVGRTGRQHPTSLSEHWRPGLMSSRRDIWEPLQVDCSLECLIDTMGWAPRQLLLFSAAAQ